MSAWPASGAPPGRASTRSPSASPGSGSCRTPCRPRTASPTSSAAARAGPTRERLDDIGGRIAEGVEDAWAIGQAGGLLTDARRRIDVAQLQRRIAEARGDDGDGGETAAALQAQLDSAARLDATIADARDRLRLTTARLDEAVVRAAEVAARAGDPAGLEALGSDVELLVQDLEALRQGLDEVDRPSPGTA